MKMTSFLLVVALASTACQDRFLPLVHGWTNLPTFHTTRRSPCQHERHVLQLSSTGGSESSAPDITNNDIYQRVFYRLSPNSEVDAYNNIVVEERVRYQKDETRDDGFAKPVGPRQLILRDGKVEEGDIGDIIYSLDVKESVGEENHHSGSVGDKELEATIATILYLAANPKYIEGNVLEVGCNLGLAGLLGCIGAGSLNTDGGENTETSSADDILTIPTKTTMTSELKQLTLSDGDQEKLRLAIANVQLSNVPVNKVAVEELAWSTRSLNRRSPKVYHAIVASDLMYNFPEAKELAHTVAYRLAALSTWEAVRQTGGDFSSKSPPTFVHVCPDFRDDMTYLQRFLSKGYRMSVNTGYVKLEKIRFDLQMLPKSESEEKLDDLELEVTSFDESIYRSLTAVHDPAYADGAGEYFFPVETGEGEASAETESGGSKW